MIQLLNVHSSGRFKEEDPMDLIDVARANQRAFEAQAHTRELRRQYHEARNIEQLERKLRAARERLVFINTAPQAS
jgi:hypothetical protein